MIELYTGIPGSGKTLSMVVRLNGLFKRWETHPEEARPVFVHNIPHLAFPVAEVPFKLSKVGTAREEGEALVPDWDSMPDGSLVLIDEAQGKIDPDKGEIVYHCFPPRSVASKVPYHVAWLNTHRHHGFDIWLTTQQPKLIDGAVRALVGRHQHYRRLFGGNRAVCYEWDACSDTLAGMKNAQKSYFPYPRDAFKFYKSAEIHTKQHFKLPLWVYVPLIGLAMGVFFIPKGYAVLHNGISGKGISTNDTKPVAASTTAPSPAKIAPLLTASSAPAAGGTVGALAPISASPPAPLVSSCISNATRCQCYTDKGVKIPLSESDCRLSAVQVTDRFKLDPKNENDFLATR
jgi:zona occludens toxin